jgi:hypothetical protein
MSAALRLNARDYVLIAAAAVLPFLVLTVYLLASRWPARWFSEVSDEVGLGISVLAAVVCIWLVRVRLPWRVIALVAYIPALCVALTMYALTFVCSTFSDCM